MRLAIIAAASPSTTGEPALGERDAGLVEDRFALADLDHRVYRVDPSIDLAEQIDELLRSLADPPSQVVLYASCLAAVVDDEECYLCLDPLNPDVGDSLSDVAGLLADAGVPLLLIAELRSEAHDAAHGELSGLLAAVQRSVPPTAAIIAAARPAGAHPERVPSRLTAALLETLDGTTEVLGARALYAKAIQRMDPGDWPHAESFVPGAGEVTLRGPELASEPAPSTRQPLTDEPAVDEAPAEQLDPDEPQIDAREVLPRKMVEQSPAAAPPGEAQPRPSRPRGGPLGPAPASERKQVATQSLRRRRRVKSTPDGLPKVVIGPPPKAMREYAAEVRREPRRQAPAKTAAATPRAKRELDVVPEPAEVEAEPSALEVETEIAAEPPEVEPAADAAEADEAQRRVAPPEVVAGTAEVDIEAPAPAVEAADGRVESDAPEVPAEVAEADVDVEPPEVAVQAGEVPTGGGAELDVLVDTEEPDSDQLPQEQGTAPPPAPSRKRASEMTAADHVDSAAGYRRLGDVDRAVKEYKKALGKLGTAATPERAQVYLQLAALMREQGKDRLAISNYDKALSINPANLDALEALIDLNAVAGNWRAVNSVEQRFFAAELDDETRLEQLLAAGDRWRQQAEDLKRARDRYTQARDSFPKRLEPLRRLALLYDAEKAIDQVLATRETIAKLGQSPRERAAALFELGEYCMFEAKREQAALDAFQRALDADPTMLEALEMVASVLAEGQEWAELEGVYAKMIGAFREQSGSEAEVVLAELYRRMALLHRDHLEDPTSALEDLRRELAIRPDHVSAQLLAAEVAAELGQSTDAVRFFRAAAWLDAGRSETYRQLFNLGLAAHDSDQAFLAASVGVLLGSADKQQFVVYRTHRLEGLPSPTRALRREAWRWLRDESRNEAVDQVMAAVAPLVLRMRVAQLESEGKLPALPAEARQDPDESTVSVVRALVWGCHYLGVTTPEIYLSEDVAGGFIAPFARQPTTMIGREVHSGITMAQRAYLVGRHVALRLPEHELVAHLSSVDEVTVCFLAALDLATGREPTSSAHAAAVATVARGLASVATEHELDGIRDAVARFEEGGGLASMKAWVASVERCAARAGLLLCGDLETAVEMARRAGDNPWLAAETLIQDLYAFTVSDQHAKLRQEIGIALAGPTSRPPLEEA